MMMASCFAMTILIAACKYNYASNQLFHVNDETIVTCIVACRYISYFCISLFLVPVETEDIPRSVSEIKAELGDKVTLHFRVIKEDEKSDLYKQSHGYIPQTVARRVFGKFSIFPPFNLTFKVEEEVSGFNLTIQSVTKGDEANYFCREQFSDSWTTGIFLSVKGKNVCLF